MTNGFVEDVMPDSSVLWLAADRTTPRQMFKAGRHHPQRRARTQFDSEAESLGGRGGGITQLFVM